MNGQTILIVDDEPEIVGLLSRVLIRQGFEVNTAQTIKEGWEKLNLACPELLFMDINLPDGNGLEELIDIKFKFPDIKVVMISAVDIEEHRKKAKQRGAFEFLSKPFQLSQVSDLVATLRKPEA
jgi:DNA-binding NtrC family response regulator